VAQALLDLYPYIGLDKSRMGSLSCVQLILFFHYLTKQLLLASWSDINVRRKFFEDYASDNGFDPLVPDQWYTQPLNKILSAKVCNSKEFFVL
jgi:hypothetical protein